MTDDMEGELGSPTEGPTSHPLYSGHVSDQSAFEHIILIRTDERKRIARELHNSTSQLLAVLQLNLGQLRRQSSPDCEAIITECEEIVAEIGRKIWDLRGKKDRPA